MTDTHALINAAFSATAGTLLVVNPEGVGELLGASAPMTFTLVGCALLLFALDIAVQTARRKLSGLLGAVIGR